jgi:hypothetical protein
MAIRDESGKSRLHSGGHGSMEIFYSFWLTMALLVSIQ